MTDKRELKPCPFCGSRLVRTGSPLDWEWQHLAEEGEGCILHDEAAAHLQDDDDVACWNTRPAAGDIVEALEREAMRLWGESPAIAKLDAYVRPEWMEVSERSREVWRGKALSIAVARQEREAATLTTEAPAQTEAKALADELEGLLNEQKAHGDWTHDKMVSAFMERNGQEVLSALRQAEAVASEGADHDD